MNLIKQLTRSDCALAAIAMLVGKERHDELWTQEDIDFTVKNKGIGDLDPWLRKAGLAEGSWKYVRTWGNSLGTLKEMLWGRKALLSVHSLNIPNGHHMLAWDGENVFDPSGLQTYATLHPAVITEIYLFKEVSPLVQGVCDDRSLRATPHAEILATDTTNLGT